MKLSRRIKDKIRNFGVKKEESMDYYFESMVSRKTGFEPEKITMMIASKKDEPHFNYFEFEYNKQEYILNNNKLSLKSNN